MCLPAIKPHARRVGLILGTVAQRMYARLEAEYVGSGAAGGAFEGGSAQRLMDGATAEEASGGECFTAAADMAVFVTSEGRLRHVLDGDRQMLSWDAFSCAPLPRLPCPATALRLHRSASSLAGVAEDARQQAADAVQLALASLSAKMLNGVGLLSSLQLLEPSIWEELEAVQPGSLQANRLIASLAKMAALLEEEFARQCTGWIPPLWGGALAALRRLMAD